MAATTKKTVSIYDYPEHLNPFREEDNHNKIRFWTIGRKLNRSNSINFSGIKELKNSCQPYFGFGPKHLLHYDIVPYLLQSSIKIAQRAFRSFMKKGKREQPKQELSKHIQDSKESSPIVFRRALQYSSFSTGSSRITVGSPENADRYVYGGSITPLPRSRFQERLRSPSQNEVHSLSYTPRMARSDVTGSQLSVESTNPFDEEPEAPVPPVRAARRKKKKAPPPPPRAHKITSDTTKTTSELQIVKEVIQNTKNTEEEEKFNVELKIVEDEESKKIEHSELQDVNNIETKPLLKSQNTEKDRHLDKKENNNSSDDEQENSTNGLNNTSFPKVNIVKYRRNSSLNEDEIKLRRGNLEDYTTAITAKRSKSLSNTFDSSYVSYDVDLNDNIHEKDKNGNEEPKKVICKIYNEPPRKRSMDDSFSSTEKEFIEIDKATRELEQEISKLNSALEKDHGVNGERLSFADIKRKFDGKDSTSPNPIPKPRRSHYGDTALLATPIEEKLHIV